MSERLVLGDILNLYKELSKTMSASEVLSIPIYIGDDEELNGIHNGWYAQLVDETNDEDEDLIELIDGNSSNIKFDKKAILIS